VRKDLCGPSNADFGSNRATYSVVPRSLYSRAHSSIKKEQFIGAEFSVNPLCNLLNVVIAIVKAAFLMGIVSEILKLGLLTPVFKNKGSNKCAVNYRGITVAAVSDNIKRGFWV
jgi:hypothetical protein